MFKWSLVLLLAFVLSCSCVQVSSLSRGASYLRAESSSSSGSASGASSAALAAEEKAEETEEDAAEAVQAKEDDEKVANALLSGELPEVSKDEKKDAQNLVEEQSMCTKEMRRVARRNRLHPMQTEKAHTFTRESDIIVPLPQGQEGLTSLLALHGDLVKAGCRITDHFCRLGHCTFRTCFCSPVGAEAKNRVLVAADEKLQKADKKLAADVAQVKEAEVRALDSGDEATAEKLEKAEEKVQGKISKDKKVEKELAKGEEKVASRTAASANVEASCLPGYRLIPSPVKPFCKKAVFDGASGFGATTFTPLVHPDMRFASFGHGFGGYGGMAPYGMFPGY